MYSVVVVPLSMPAGNPNPSDGVTYDIGTMGNDTKTPN
jgi:hypothetical protein